MIQLNLLPDVKLEYIRAQRARRLVISVSIIVTVASVVLLLLLLSYDALQKKHLNDLTNDISSESSKLQNESQIGRILTVQNQLGSLTQLHAQAPAASSVFADLNELTPVNINISDFTIDFTEQTVTITGTSDTLANVNKYIDTLKYTGYTTSGNSDAAPAFSDVVLSNFGLNSDADDPSQAANYTITANYDQNIFDITQNTKLSVPNLVTTRSLDQPGDLFKATPTKGGQ